VPAWMQTVDALVELGRLLRSYYGAAERFVPPLGASWRAGLGSPGGPIIRHVDSEKNLDRVIRHPCSHTTYLGQAASAYSSRSQLGIKLLKSGAFATVYY
jgi:hypothetical protein